MHTVPITAEQVAENKAAALAAIAAYRAQPVAFAAPIISNRAKNAARRGRRADKRRAMEAK